MPKRGWEIPEREATPEDVYMNRRKFMVAAGGALGALAGCGHEKIF
ncbi:MAG: twin-arginine translocation signal domain-containing protein, partial [Gemmatimonadetes bacterium]|nr:twin-arginine translocation signal domain-containing protein [Gemmatimonadota bacterium]